MVAFLSDDWFAAVRADGVALDDVTVEATVTGAAGSDVKWHVQVRAGTVAAAAGDAPDAEVALTLGYDDAVAVLRGDLAPSVAFMQGRMKTAGDPGPLLDVLRATASPRFASAREALAASTET
jgi:hypothetical protein